DGTRGISFGYCPRFGGRFRGVNVDYAEAIHDRHVYPIDTKRQHWENLMLKPDGRLDAVGILDMFIYLPNITGWEIGTLGICCQPIGVYREIGHFRREREGDLAVPPKESSLR